MTHTFRAAWRADDESQTFAELWVDSDDSDDSDDRTAGRKKAGTVKATWRRPFPASFATAISFLQPVQKAVRALNDPCSDLESLVIKVTTDGGKLEVGSRRLTLTHEHVNVSGKLDGRSVTVQIARNGLPLPAELIH